MIASVVSRYRSAYAGLPVEIWLLAAVLFVNRCGSMVLPFFTLYLTSELHMSESSAGRMIGVYGIGAVLGAYLGGRLSESIGAVRVQTIGMLLAVPLFLIIPLWESWQGIAVSLFALSVCNEAVRPANAVAITRLTNLENRVQAFALQRLAANLGFSFGPAIGGILATIHFGLLFLVDGVTTLAAGLVLLAYFRLRRYHNASSTQSDSPDSGSPARDLPYLVFLGLCLIQLIVFCQFGSTYPLYLQDHYHLTKPQIGMMFSVNTVTIVIFEMVLIDAIRQWNYLRTIAWGSLLTCLGFGILPFGTSGLFCVFSMLIVTFGEMLVFPLSTGFVSSRSPRGSEGRYMAWYSMTLAISSVVAPVVGAAVYQVNQELIWLVGGMIGFVCLGGFSVLAAHLNE